MRGWHFCEFCDRDDRSFDPTHIEYRGRTVPLGDAEIRVQGAQGTLDAAPNLICHYVTEHAYAPPPEFIEAVSRHGP
jgi:hypothetical protein